MRSRRLSVTAVALALLGLTGCGQESAATLTRVHDFTAYGGKAPASAKPTSGPVAADIWAKTLATFSTCKSVRIDGTTPSGTRTATVTLAGTCDGTNARAQTTTEAVPGMRFPARRDARVVATLLRGEQPPQGR